MSGIGRTCWVLAGGHIPLHSSGREPEETSRDELCALNTGDAEATLEITIYYGDREPVGPYRLIVLPCRVRHARLNDLIDPEAIPLDTPYAAVIRSDVPVVVQFIRYDSSRGQGAWLGLHPFSET